VWPSSRVAVVVALVSMVAACGAPTDTATPSPVTLQNLRLINYFPADASWTNMWSRFEAGTIATDFGTIKRIDGNAVRLTIDPYEFGWPRVAPAMADELHTVIGLAQADGLYVQLTLFDWFADYGNVADSLTWLKSLLAPYHSDPEIAFIDLQNEINTSNPRAMAWAGAIMMPARAIAGTIPLTFSASSPQAVLALKQGLGREAPAFYDFHYYGLPGAAATVLSAIKSEVGPEPVFVGETGMSTYSASGTPEEAVLASVAANYYAAVENATASLGLPPAAPWMLNDLVSTGVPRLASQDPDQRYYGLFTTNGAPKPAAAVVENFFSTGAEPLLLDPGFEQGANGVPTGWAPTSPSTGRLTWASGTSHSGSYSVKISGSGSQAAWAQIVNTGMLSTGEQLQATVWAEGSAATGVNDLNVAWFGPGGNYLSSSVSARLPDGTSNWTELSVEAITPANAAYAVLYLDSSHNAGGVFFDDAAVVY
jgi:hypothetical protein